MKKNDKIVSEETKIWHEEPQHGPVKAVVILAHGLNLRPQKMDGWSKILSSHGAQIIRFALYGHTGDLAHMQSVTPDVWRAQFDEVVNIAKIRAEEDGVPIYFIGFSLGALVGLEWLSRQPPDGDGFKKMVLIAPALSVPWYSRFAIKMLSAFGTGFMLPSRSPEDYRANKGTSVAAYQALFQLKEALEQNNYQNANVDTLVIIDRDDELVDSGDIRSTITQHQLSNWTLEMVDNRFAYTTYGFRHLLVDENAMGKELWGDLSRMVLRHLRFD
jgi:pimeloyl-ACP methyl ester carboxylesterase